MNARESPDAGVLLLQPILHQVVQVPEAPRDKPQPGDAEERVQDLTVDLEPLLRGAVDVAAGRVAHGGRGADEDEEEHAAPGDDVEAVDGNQEAEGGGYKFPKCFEADLCGLPGAVFGWELVAVGVGLARVVRHVRGWSRKVN